MSTLLSLSPVLLLILGGGLIMVVVLLFDVKAGSGNSCLALLVRFSVVAFILFLVYLYWYR